MVNATCEMNRRPMEEAKEEQQQPAEDAATV